MEKRWHKNVGYQTPATGIEVLVVENDAVIAMDYLRALEASGMKVTLAYSAEQAMLELAKEKRYSVILLDNGLGSGMSGEGLAEMVYDGNVPGCTQNIPIIGIGSFGTDGMAHLNAYYSKTRSLAGLISLILQMGSTQPDTGNGRYPFLLQDCQKANG